MAETRLDIEGFAYFLNFQGFDTIMEARAPTGATLVLQPWRLREHLAALGACARPSPAGLRLNAAALARQVLRRNGAAEESAPSFAPLALWWASGGAEAAPAARPGWLRFGAARARLRVWSGGERFRALALARSASPASARASSAEAADSGVWLDLPRYLRAMLEASVVELDPGQPLDELDSGIARPLLETVIALNQTGGAPLNDAPTDLESARLTLRLCRALGWTPAQVWACPAPELDRLLALLDISQGANPARPQRPKTLADHPDAIVIRIGDAA
jgi:hypothetical protein